MALSAFEKAFKAARQSGENEFEFGGKKYTTKYKEEVSAPAKKSASAPEVKKSGTPNLPVTKAESSDDSGEGKPYRPKNLTDLIGLSSNIRKPAAEPASAPAMVSTGSRVPTSEQAAANRQAVYDKFKSVGSSVGDYVKNFETPAERRARERKESSGMKRGGAVKKMASGGMTASRRADGIASRGKTRCKMY